LENAQIAPADGQAEDGAAEVACVIPTYENMELAARAITSALAQEGVSNLVIVSDDSRNDRIHEFVSALMPLYPNLRYVPGAQNGNPVANWNHGLRLARTPYAVLVHHDEFFIDREYLRKAVARLDATGAVATVAESQVIGVARVSRFATVRRLLNHKRTPLWTLWLTNWLGSTACLVFRREGAPEFDEALISTVDIDFYTRLLGKRSRLERLSGLMVGSLGLHESQITTQVDLHGLAYAEVLGKQVAGAYDFPPWKWRLIARYWKLRGV
jgi:glycosyltransferase involved in cell wall biosynthesis